MDPIDLSEASGADDFGPAASPHTRLALDHSRIWDSIESSQVGGAEKGAHQAGRRRPQGVSFHDGNSGRAPSRKRPRNT
jgi:hypothetical protein